MCEICPNLTKKKHQNDINGVALVLLLLTLNKYIQTGNYLSRTLYENVFKNGPSKICGRQPFKNLKGYGLRKQNFFKGRLPQILFGPFLNTLYSVRSEMSLTCSLNYHLNQKIVAK